MSEHLQDDPGKPEHSLEHPEVQAAMQKLEAGMKLSLEGGRRRAELADLNEIGHIPTASFSVALDSVRRNYDDPAKQACREARATLRQLLGHEQAQQVIAEVEARNSDVPGVRQRIARRLEPLTNTVGAIIDNTARIFGTMGSATSDVVTRDFTEGVRITLLSGKRILETGERVMRSLRGSKRKNDDTSPPSKRAAA